MDFNEIELFYFHRCFNMQMKTRTVDTLYQSKCLCFNK